LELLLALIQQNAALLFWESRDLKPVLLSEAVSQRKITANSTYWKAKVRNDGLVEGEGVGRGKKGGFGGVNSKVSLFHWIKKIFHTLFSDKDPI
jgi:hypothetical protein